MPRLESMGQGNGERCSVSLERGVAPVALVLHFKRLAFHGHPGEHAGSGLRCDGTDIEEWLMGRDKFRESVPGDAPVDMFNRHGLARDLCGVEDAEAGPIRAHRTSRLADQCILDAATGFTANVPAPEKIDFRLRVDALGVEGQMKRIGLRFDDEIGEARPDGRPSFGANGAVDRAEHFPSTDFEVAQESPLRIEMHGHRTGAQGDLPSRRLRSENPEPFAGFRFKPPG